MEQSHQGLVDPVEEASRYLSSLTEDGRYRLLVDAVKDYAIYMLDPSGMVSSWNAGAERFKGYKAGEILGQHFSRFYTEEDRALDLPRLVLELAARAGKFEGEGWRVRKDGTRFWAHVVVDTIHDPDGRLVGFAKITRDLSERKASEEILRKSEVQFRLLVQGVSDYAIYMLSPEGLVSSWNDGARRIKGYAEEEVLGSHFSRFYRPEDAARGEPIRALDIASRTGQYEAEGWRVRKDGSHFWASVVIDVLRDRDGELVGFAKITRDVTAKRDAQLALEKAQEALFQSQKLDAIGQLTGGVAHDFNNLLTVIVSSLEMMRRHVKDDARLVRLISHANEAAKRGSSLTHRMLSFGRRQELNNVPLDLRALADGMYELMRRSLDPSIRIEVASTGSVAPVLADANQLELALLNLVVNSRDAMPDGGTIVITSREEARPPAGSGLADVPHGVLSVRDDGQGMDEATLRRATEPFYTTKGVGKGTGLGLSMVDGLASQSGGRLLLSSTPGVGTTAELWFPVAVGRVVEDTAVPRDGATVASRPLRILVVDDDDLVLANTVAMVEELGHVAVGVPSGAAAMAAIDGDPSIEVLLTDHAMPGMTGLQLIDALRETRPGLATILASGYAELSSAPAADVLRLSKPFGLEVLATVLAATVERRPGPDTATAGPRAP